MKNSLEAYINYSAVDDFEFNPSLFIFFCNFKFQKTGKLIYLNH